MILLDTNAFIALAEGWKVRHDARTAIDAASLNSMLCVSATAAWELGLLATRTATTARLFEGDARSYFSRTVRDLSIAVIDLSAEMALDAAYLPPGCPNDLADRWTIAVARVTRSTLVTSDRAILAYAAQGYLNAIRR